MLSIHPEGYVHLNGFSATKAELESVVGSLDVPDGIGVEYDGQRSARFIAGNQYPGPLPWMHADTILANAPAIIADIRQRRQMAADIAAANAQAAEDERRAALSDTARAAEDLNRLSNGAALAFALAVQLDGNFARQSPEVQAVVNNIVAGAKAAALAVLNQ